MLLFGACVTVYAAQCKAPVAPPGVKLQMVAEEMRINDVPTTIRAFSTKMSVDTVLTYYRNVWARLATANRPGFMENINGEWQLISTIEGECFTVVQVKILDGGAYGLISMTTKPTNQTKLIKVGKDFPVLPGSVVMNDFDYADGIRNARTIVLTNQSALTANVAYYRNEFKSRGWQVMTDKTTADKTSPSYVMVMRKGLEEASVVISRTDGDVQVVANIVDKP